MPLNLLQDTAKKLWYHWQLELPLPPGIMRAQTPQTHHFNKSTTRHESSHILKPQQASFRDRGLA